MKEKKVFTTAIAEFYVHDRRDKVLTGSFHHPTQRRVGCHIQGRAPHIQQSSDWQLSPFHHLTQRRVSFHIHGRTIHSNVIELWLADLELYATNANRESPVQHVRELDYASSFNTQTYTNSYSKTKMW